ncbi:MAG: sugar phosphate isomerase/epimerase [bacterium]|nr:MAG: sugar phosphate isomerase/epimerase [bacterium]
MKLSIVLSTQPAQFNALAYQGQLAENIAKIKKLGYDGVELAVRDPNLLDLTQLKNILNDNRLPVPAIGTGQAYGEEKLSFTDRHEKIRRQAINRIKSHVNLANHFGALVIIGLVQGKIGSEVDEHMTEQWLIEALTECASENKAVKIVIEPINRYETDLINTVDSGMKFLDKLKQENVGLLLDTFHMNIEEPSIIDSIIMAKDRLYHFHVADSNRRYPGAGHIDFREIIDTLVKINYNGFISAEIMPIPDADTAARKTYINMKKILEQIST